MRVVLSKSSFVLFLMAVPMSVGGQVVATLNGSSASRAFSVQQIPRVISLNVKNVPLSVAIREISSRAGIQIAYADTVVQGAPRVSLAASDISAKEALERILRGTSLRVTTYGGQLAVERVRPPATTGRGVIVGKVINAKTKTPLAGATVTIDDAEAGVSSGTDGSFRVSAELGERIIRVRMLGYTRKTQRIVVPGNASITVEIALEPNASVLSEIVVTGTVVETERKAIATPITVVTAEAIEQRGITRIDQLFRGEIPGVLALETGTVQYNSELGKSVQSAVFSRGSSSLQGAGNPIKTYIDGVELLDPSYLGTIDPKSIERIEIVTGPQAATIYGSGAMGGVMQIFTKKGSANTSADVLLSLGYGILESNVSPNLTPKHTHSMNVTGGNGPAFSFAGTASYGYTGQWSPRLFARVIGGSVGATTQQGAFNISGSVALTASRNGTIGDGFRLMTIIPGVAGGPSLIEREWMETGETLDFGAQGTVNGGAQRISTAMNQTLSLNLDYRPVPWWQGHITLGRTQNHFKLVPENPTFFRSADSLYFAEEASGGKITLNGNSTFVGRMRDMTSTLTIGGNNSAGYNTKISACLGTTESTQFISCSGSQSATVTPPVVTRTVGDRNWGGFSSLQLGFLEKLFLSFGVRGERNPNYGTSHKVDWTPTTGVTYTVDYDDLSIKLMASYGRATRSPGPDQRLERMSAFVSSLVPAQYLEQLASPDLTPEYSQGPQGGIELYYGNTISLTLNRYQQTIAGLLQAVVVDSVWRDLPELPQFSSYYLVRQWQNIARIRQHGWEATGGWRLWRIDVKGTYTWSDSRILSLYQRVGSSTTLFEGASFTNLPTHYANLTGTYAFGGSRLSLVTNFTGRSPIAGNIQQRWKLNQIARIRTYVGSVSGARPSQTLSAYAKSDLLFSQRINPSITANVTVLNIASQYRSDLGDLYPTLGRQTMLGISIRLP